MIYQITKYYKIIIFANAIISVGYPQFNDHVEAVLKVNPAIVAAEQEYKSALEKIKTKGVLPDPKVEAMYSIDAIETRNGPIENQIMVGQTFPTFGKLRIERNIEKLNAELTKQKLDQVKLDIAFDLRKQLSNYHKYRSTLDILIHFKDKMKIFQKISNTQYENGIASQNSTIKLQIEESLIESKINKTQIDLETTINNLNVLYNGTFNENVNKSDSVIEIASSSVDSYINQAHIVNPYIVSALLTIQIAEYNYKLSKLGYFPNITFGLTYSQIGSTELGGAVFSGKDALGTKIGINLPFWFGKNKARVKSSSFMLNRQKELLLNTKNKIESNINSAFIELSEFDDTYKLYTEKIINDTERMISSAISGYENGSLNFLDLLDSIKLNVNVKLEFEDIKSKRVIAQSRLNQSVGIIYSN